MKHETEGARIERYAALASEHHLDPAELDDALTALEAELDAALARRSLYVRFLHALASILERITARLR